MHPIPDTLPRARLVGSHFHIILRGSRRRVLFSSAEDRRALNSIAIKTLRRFNATLHAYCLLPNHFRFLVQIKDRNLIGALRRIATKYERYRQRGAQCDPLFERPFEARRVETGDEFLRLLRSIHVSPVLGHNAIELDDYRWSSHRAYLGYKSVAWITTDFGLSLLSPDRILARTAYQRFIAEGLAIDVADEHTASCTSTPKTAGTTTPAVTAARLGSARSGKQSRRYLSIY